MKRAFKWAGLCLLTLLLLVAAVAVHTWYAKPLSINWFYTRVFAQFALDNPELLTRMRLVEPMGIRGHNAKLADSSPAETERAFARLQDDYATLKRYDSRAYTGQDRLSYEILDYFIGIQVRGGAWRYHNFPVNQLFGIQSELPNLMTQSQQVNDATDAEHYLARLGQFPRKLEEVIESLKLRESKKIIPPKFVVEKVSEQINRFLAAGVQGNALTVDFKAKLEKLPAEKMAAPTRDALIKRAENTVASSVIPAYTQLLAYIETLRTKALTNDGAWSLPDGDKYYQHQVEAQTTSKMQAVELHQLGLTEVARIGAEMDAILEKEGYMQPTRAERLATLSKSPTQTYPDSDQGRVQVLKDYQSIIDEILAGLDPWFATKPKAGVVVECVPAVSEKTSAFAYYNAPPFDGSKRGVFYANLRKVDEIAKFGMRTLAYHEAVPGHHLQIAIVQELTGLPIFRKVIPFTAYSEGWALYAERLAWEAGYQKKPLDNLGRLQAEIFRAVRLVVDTGIHAKRWTREQAIDYMLANTGMAEVEVIAEIERYFVMPGQALAYKVGMMKILELREKAQQSLGSRFSIRDFHDAVLRNGAMPLDVLERVIDDYIADRKGAEKSKQPG